MSAFVPLAANPAVPANAAKAPAATRLDLYAGIHKALRLFMGDTLARVGRLDVDDRTACGATLSQLDSLLEVCRGHVAHENRFVHVALEARRPGASARIGAEHDEHLEALAALAADVAALRALPTAAAAHRLYRHLALFVADNFSHMHVEETAHNAALWSAYTDAELAEIHQRLVASIDPAEMAVVLRWMAPALNPAERIELLRDMQRQLPAEAFRGALDIVRSQLDEAAWATLARALGVPPVPGLVTV